MISVVNKLFGKEEPWVALIAAILLGVVLAHLYTWASRKFILTVVPGRSRAGPQQRQTMKDRDVRQ